MGIANLGSIQCCCGRWLTVLPDSKAAFCVCGARNEVTEIQPHRDDAVLKKACCQHRGPSIGRASCGCGTIYHCELLGTYCGDREVVEYATIGADVLTRENYRKCQSCSDFKQPEAT